MELTKREIKKTNSEVIKISVFIEPEIKVKKEEKYLCILKDEQLFEDWYDFASNIESIIGRRGNIYELTESNLGGSCSQYMKFYVTDFKGNKKEGLIDLSLIDKSEIIDKPRSTLLEIKNANNLTNYKLLFISVNDEPFKTYNEALKRIEELIKNINEENKSKFTLQDKYLEEFKKEKDKVIADYKRLANLGDSFNINEDNINKKIIYDVSLLDCYPYKWIEDALLNREYRRVEEFDIETLEDLKRERLERIKDYKKFANLKESDVIAKDNLDEYALVIVSSEHSYPVFWIIDELLNRPYRELKDPSLKNYLELTDVNINYTK